MPSKLDWLDFVLIILATYRLAQLVSKDDGPFDVFKNARLFAKKRAGYHQGIMKNSSIPDVERFIASRLFIFWRSIVGWLECPYCNGVWFAVLCLALIMPPARLIGFWIIAWLAIAGGQAFLQDVSQK